MPAHLISVNDLLTTHQFRIPPYQRPYQWDVEHAEKLVNDVYDSYQANEAEYFIGSTICIASGDRLEVIDGQQRLITLTLFLLQLANRIELEDAQYALRGMVFRQNAFVDPVVREFCMNVREAENNFYQEYVVNDNYPASTSNEQVFINNYNKIGECLQQKLEDGMGQTQLREFAFYLLKSVRIVFVTVDDRTSAFRLFNVLNNRGLPLSDADLIKNEILRRADEIEHMQRAEDSWLNIENLVGTEDLNLFLVLHQISKQTDRNRNRGNAFEYYAARLNNAADAMLVLDELLTSARYHRDMLHGNTATMPYRALFFLKALDKARYKEWLPAFMAFLNAGRFSNDEFSQFVYLLEKVYIHKFFQDQRSSQRDAACYHAIEAINNDCSFDEVMSSIRVLADNEGFRESLNKPNFYDPSRHTINKFARLVLCRVDRELYYVGGGVVPYPDAITVEHILPRNMDNPYWQERFTLEQHAEWLHRLGNLTLLSNAIGGLASNSGFDVKQQDYQNAEANQVNPFAMTQQLCDRANYDDWNVDTIRARHELLSQQIFALWQVEEILL